MNTIQEAFKMLKEAHKPAYTSLEDCQKWVDYDMKHYGKISDTTNKIIKKAGFQIIKDQYGDYEVSAGKYESLTEDFNSSFPVEILPTNEVRRFIEDIPEATISKPPVFFKLGYAKELGREIASEFRGGRRSEGNPFVRIVKCTEYSKLYTGVPWLGTNLTKKADKVLGRERHTGEKTGFNFRNDEAIENRIGVYANGRLALQAYIADSSIQRVKFFISLDDEDLHEASREEIAQYLTPKYVEQVLNPSSSRAAAGFDDEGNEVFDKPINRFYLDQIYMIGHLGNSIF